jgi:uncharacterized protein YndB with AHSA1/START domain
VGSPAVFTRQIALPRAIVWDALVDGDLVSGWLAEADIVAEVGGRYTLRWHAAAALADTAGVIRALHEPTGLRVDLGSGGTLAFDLVDVPGGSRDRSTLLTVTVDADPRPGDFVEASWRSNLDQLEQLLTGHPVDWAGWPTSHGPAWRRYRREASSPAR